MGFALGLIRGLGLGAGLMYLFDPDTGRRRRALLRDQYTHMCNALEDFMGKAMRDLSNRANGVIAELSTLFHDDTPDDRVLVDRVRSKLGRVVSHPHAVQVIVWQGRVTLRGTILADEFERLLTVVAGVRGVEGVESRLDVHDRPKGISALQGGVPRPGERSELFQETWSPATKLLVGAAGTVLALRLAGRGGLTGLAVGALGVGLAAGAFSKLDWPGSEHGETGHPDTAGDAPRTEGPSAARPGPSVRSTGL